MNEKWKKLPASCTLKVVFWMFVAAFLIAAFISPDRAEMLSGLQAIYSTPAQVTKDYFEVGSVSAAFMNAFLVGTLCAGLYMLSGQPQTTAAGQTWYRAPDPDRCRFHP